jgi:hypothetical protein
MLTYGAFLLKNEILMFMMEPVLEVNSENVVVHFIERLPE